MKNFLITIALFVLASCNSKKKAETETNQSTVDGNTSQNNPPPAAVETQVSIVGKWILSEVSNKDMTEEEKKEAIGHASIEFTADGKYMANFKEDNEAGTYSYDENTKTLTTAARGDEEEKLTATISNDKLSVTNNEGTMVFKRGK